jgi:hypothetical protein
MQRGNFTFSIQFIIQEQELEATLSLRDNDITTIKTNSVAFSPQAHYTD